MTALRIFIGFDPTEHVAWQVAARSAGRFGHVVTPIVEERLRIAGLMTRPTDRRGALFDLNSNAPQSTEFALSRFFVPLLAHSGWALFTDSDVVFMEDPAALLETADSSFAVHVVKHPQIASPDIKMRGQQQTIYARKNWSSVVLWNCDHPANRRLNLTCLNQWPGRDLHGFAWLADSEIGSLPAEANWLVGLQPCPVRPIIAHYTLGTPDMPGLENSEHAEIWHKARAA